MKRWQEPFFGRLMKRWQEPFFGHTTIGTGIASAVRRISIGFEVRGLVQKMTSFDNPTVGSEASSTTYSSRKVVITRSHDDYIRRRMPSLRREAQLVADEVAPGPHPGNPFEEGPRSASEIRKEARQPRQTSRSTRGMADG